jgi:hypothetical protein
MSYESFWLGWLNFNLLYTSTKPNKFYEPSWPIVGWLALEAIAEIRNAFLLLLLKRSGNPLRQNSLRQNPLRCLRRSGNPLRSGFPLRSKNPLRSESQNPLRSGNLLRNGTLRSSTYLSQPRFAVVVNPVLRQYSSEERFPRTFTRTAETATRNADPLLVGASHSKSSPRKRVNVPRMQ